jgi:hypothetical protein
MIGKHIFFMKIKKIDSSKSVLQMHIASAPHRSLIHHGKRFDMIFQ